MPARKNQTDQPTLLSSANATGTLAARHRRVLFLPAYLSGEAKKRAHVYQTPIERGHAIIKKWIELERKGYLEKKETALDADFLREIFAEALGYAPVTDERETFELDRMFTVPGVGTADGALGTFSRTAATSPVAVIELKGADASLDTDRFAGRTPVQQLWDYLNALPGCPWGIVSNFVSFRLYHRDHGSRAFEHFTLDELGRPERFREFYYVFGRGGLLPTNLDPTPRAVRLLRMTGERQRAVGDDLYEAYSRHRLELICHLHAKHAKATEQAIAIAQKLLDRIVFVAFCEDRGLLPAKTIDRTYRAVPPMSRVTNPRWQNFVNLFHAVDRGHRDLEISAGYNGGLFEHDPEVDDLKLDDQWTDFFRSVGNYDFRDEVNVDVLGHLFEKSVTELEKLREGGLFGNGAGEATEKPAMPKSAERKRFGIYYTPPAFTRYIVDQTVGALVRSRFARLAQQHKVDPQNTGAGQPPGRLQAYWNDCLAALRAVKVCDPACGSGAFLIQAFDLLEEIYIEVLESLSFNGAKLKHRADDDIPDMILGDNLFGVDVSREAVEITQLALWIRSARRDRKLSDLSRNIVWGNSLVDDPAVHGQAIDWEKTFPTVFERATPGFDCVIGNPPWERLKLQEREFFSLSAPEIAGAVSAAKRREMIAALEEKNPELHARYRSAQDTAGRVLDFARRSGRYPLTGKGDINTYALFAELARTLVSAEGRVGLLVPSGIASDKTTKEFFAELMESRALISLHDFENRKRIFPDVDNRFKFSTLVFGGTATRAGTADFMFFAHRMSDLREKERHIELSAADMALVNPNTRTCPVFRTRRDAQLTMAIYRRVPILVDRTRESGGDPWGIKFVRMFDQTNDAELFCAPGQLTKEGFKLEGNCWRKGRRLFLPLYEAKMVQAYDHRAAGVIIEKGNWVRQGQTEPTSLVAHQNPEFVVQPRWWVDAAKVEGAVKQSRAHGFIGFKDITSPTNERTMIAAAIPWSAVTNHFPLIFTTAEARPELCLLANLNSLALDYVTRQKIGGVTLNFFIVEQLPILPPDTYDARCPWRAREKLLHWVSERVLKLTCTANDLLPLAEAADFKPLIHKWRMDERAHLRAELDAAYFHLYGLARDDVEYILSTFTGVRRHDVAETGTFRTADLILEAYDGLKANS
ncbi:MAG: N-6 DNA methylase [Planctomycetes bacterium]|nr:N-6 DNA methylase [Planctomycetota bacterium]